jgi:DNA repair exonuclease SbcCD ATPase subunit
MTGSSQETERRLEKVSKELSEVWGEGRSRKRLIDLMGRMMNARSSIMDLVSDEMERSRNSVVIIANEQYIRMGGRPEDRIIVHEDSFRLGIIRKGGGRERVLPMSQLSAGERELVSLAVLAALNQMTGSMLMMDSPFMHLDDTRSPRVLEGLCSGRPTYISVPSGAFSEMVLKEFGDKGIRTYVLKMEEGGSMMEVVR